MNIRQKVRVKIQQASINIKVQSSNILPLPQKLYKNYTIYIQKSYETLNLYIFCIQKLCKSKFHMTMNLLEMYNNIVHMHKKYTDCGQLVQIANWKELKTGKGSFLYIPCTNYTKPIQITNWNCHCMFFVFIHNVQTIQNL